jgi:hypothetical protein
MSASAVPAPVRNALTREQEQALIDARNMATAALGREVRVVVPPRYRGMFRGKVIGVTASHILQHVDDGSKGIVVLHPTNRLQATKPAHDYPFPIGGEKVHIVYAQNKKWRFTALTREIQHARSPELEP